MQSKSNPNEAGSKENSADQIHQHASSSTASGTSPETSRGYRTVRRGSYFIDSTDSDVLHPQVSNPPSPIVPSSVHAPAQSRRLSDIDVDGKIIDECFQM
jgi:hypothetical protein